MFCPMITVFLMEIKILSNMTRFAEESRMLMETASLSLVQDYVMIVLEHLSSVLSMVNLFYSAWLHKVLTNTLSDWTLVSKRL